MDSVRNCARCGRVFVFRGREICPDCVAEEEEQFERVRLFLRDSPGASLAEVEEATGVPADVILSFLRQGRLLASDGLKGNLRCERCGAPIDEGHLCSRCSEELAREVGRFREPEAGKSSPAAQDFRKGKMYVADIVKRGRSSPDK